MDYFDANLDLTEENPALKSAAHQFAEEVVRPTAKALDARATLIEEGNNEILARHGGHTLFEC